MARKSREEWLEHARAWKASGLECGEFAKKKGLRPRTLSWWAWKLRSEGEQLERRPRKNRATPAGRSSRRAAKKDRPGGIELVELAPLAITAQRVELEVAGVTVRLPDEFAATTLSKVLEVLEARR